MVTREQVDSWCEKRPAYAAGSIPAKKCLNDASMTPNYYVSCSTTGGKMPTYDDLTKIRFAEIVFHNNGSQSRSLRAGFKVYGSPEPITWCGFHTTGIDETYTFVLEGLASGTSYAVYIQESSNTQDMFGFINGSYVSTVTGYGYIQSTLISGSQQKSTQYIHVYVSTMKISIRVKNDDLRPMNIHLWGSVYDQTAISVTEYTFENIPFNNVFSISIWGVNATPGYDIGAWCGPTPYDFQAIYLANDECEYEFNTGSTLGVDYYEVTIVIP